MTRLHMGTHRVLILENGEERHVFGRSPNELPSLDIPQETEPAHFGSTFCEPARRAECDPSLPYDWTEGADCEDVERGMQMIAAVVTAAGLTAACVTVAFMLARFDVLGWVRGWL